MGNKEKIIQLFEHPFVTGYGGVRFFTANFCMDIPVPRIMDFQLYVRAWEIDRSFLG